MIYYQRKSAARIVSLGLLLGAAMGIACRSHATAQPLPAKSAAEKKILAVLERMEKSGGKYLAVDSEGGRMLRVLTESMGAKNVVEVGTSTGYSGLWLSMALTTTGGKLTTFEIDAKRAAQARANFEEAGVGSVVKVVEGDAHKNVAQLSGPIDLVFIDADKEGYPDYLAKVLPLVRPGGLIVADNIDHSREYASAVTNSPDLETIISGGRMAVTLKKR